MNRDETIEALRKYVGLWTSEYEAIYDQFIAPLEAERDAAVALQGHAGLVINGWIKRAEQAEAERDAALARIAELEALLRSLHLWVEWNCTPMDSSMEENRAQLEAGRVFLAAIDAALAGTDKEDRG